MTDDVAQLVQAAQRGNRQAFGALYARFARLVYGVLLARVPRADVDDLLQDVFITAMRRLTSLKDPRAFGGWLTTIARNRAADHLRHAARTSALEEPMEDETARATTPPDRAAALAVVRAIRSLPEAYRETLMLRLVEGMTGPEIADRTGLTHASVRVNLHRGMRQLRERLSGVL